MCRSLFPCNQVSYCEGIVETQCSRPYDTLSCHFHTAQWLGKCQSILTQTQHSSESDMACYRIFHVNFLTCSEVGPMSLEWPLAPQGGLRWRRDALQPPEVQRDRLNRYTCAHIPDGGLRCVTWNTRGLFGSPASPQLSREKKHIYLTRHAKNNDVICLQEFHERMNSYRLLSYWSHNSGYLAHSYRTI